jgi:hypothetical protein
MPSAPSQIDKMSQSEVRQLKERLLKAQGNVCFLCGKGINLDADKTEIDHVRPRADQGPDEESNWALMHDHCNNKERAKNLELARVLMKFEQLEEKYEGAITSGEVLKEFGGSKDEIYLEDHGGKVLLRYDDQGKIIDYESPIITDPNNPSYRTFFTALPIKFLFHDEDLNPRKIIDIDKLIVEFWRRNPQLQVSLARLNIDGGKGKGKVLLFDGQHKTATQIILGNTYIPVRIFLNPDKQNLKETNRRAHKELRQVEFFRSVLDSLGQDIFSVNFKRFLENPTTSPKSEEGYIKSVEADRRRCEEAFQ